MTPVEAQQRIDEIKAVRGDPEAAHVLESELYLDFVIAVSQSDHPLSDTASKVLKSRAIKFPRWFA